jgi:hypothetical protein
MSVARGKTVRLRAEDITRLERLTSRVAQKGWAVVGSTSTEPATRASVAAFAIEKLEERSNKK